MPPAKPTSLPDHPLDSRLAPLRQRKSRRLQGPDANEWRLELEADMPAWFARLFPAGALVFASNGAGDHLYLTGDHPGVMVFWHEGHEHAQYCQSVDDLLPSKKRPPSDHPPIHYFGSGEQVLPGDQVFVKYWLFFSGRGTVTYVPGLSPLKRELERDGLAWVRARLESGAVVDTVVIDGVLKKSTSLLARAPSSK